MLEIKPSPIGKATGAIIHLFTGVMKADGIVTLNEEVIVEDLINNETDLPGDKDMMIQGMHDIMLDDDYKNWSSYDHLLRAIEYYDKFVASDLATEKQVDAVIFTLERLARVDGLMEDEQNYIKQVTDEFKNRYNYTES